MEAPIEQKRQITCGRRVARASSCRVSESCRLARIKIDATPTHVKDDRTLIHALRRAMSVRGRRTKHERERSRR